MLKNKSVLIGLVSLFGIVSLFWAWNEFGATHTNSHEQKVERYFEVIWMEKAFEPQAGMMVDVLIQSYPMLEKHRKSLQAFHDQKMKNIIKNHKQACLSTYTEAELDELIAFYESPIGKIIAKKTPEFTYKTMNTDILVRDAKEFQIFLENLLSGEK